MAKQMPHPGYFARNLDLANAVGLNAGLCKTRDRMARRRDCPLWFIEEMDDYIQRSNEIIGILKRRRDDLPAFIDAPDAGGEDNEPPT